MRFVMIPLLAGLLVSCGGGGGGSSTSTPALPSTPTSTTYLVTAVAQAGGVISPASATVAAGATTRFTVTPASGYAVAAVSGCGGSLAGDSYTTAGVFVDCAITVTFAALDFHVDVAGNSLGGLVIANNGSDKINVDSDGRFTFTTGINVGAPYSVRVDRQPVAQVCRVTNGDGVISATSAAVSVQCVNRAVSTLLLTLRTAVDTAGQFRQFLYFRARGSDLLQFRIGADGALEEVAPVWSVPPYIQTFTFSADGARVFADDGLGSVSAATVRDSDGAVIPAWTAVFGSYVPQPPVLFSPARPSHDGRMLYRNFTPIIGGVRYDDLWVGTVSDSGVSMLALSPFALGSDGGVPNFDPSGRYLVRLLRNGRHLDVYRSFASTTQQPELLHQGTQTLQSGSSVTVFAEGAPGKYLYEASLASESFSVQAAPPQIALHAWQADGALVALGGALQGGALTGEIASQVCIGGSPDTSRISFFGPLPPASARPSRYLLQRQDTSCIGPLGTGLADTRVLGLYLLSVVAGQAAHAKLPLEARPEWSDLGGGGWVHPTKPWLYLGSKHSQRIYAYAVDEAAGTVQPIAGSPFAVEPLPQADGVSLPALIMDPSAKFMYLARFSSLGTPSNYLAAFSVDPTTGALTAIATYTP
jgi:hypothetical protein